MKVKYLIIGGTLIGAFALMSFIKAKTAQAKDVFEKILFKVGFPKNFDISTTRLRFYIDFTLQNPTAQDFTARTGNLITAKAYRVYRGNEVVAFGDLGNNTPRWRKLHFQRYIRRNPHHRPRQTYTQHIRRILKLGQPLKRLIIKRQNQQQHPNLCKHPQSQQPAIPQRIALRSRCRRLWTAIHL